MANLGKRLLSAFVEVTDDEPPASVEEAKPVVMQTTAQQTTAPAANSEKFSEYFTRLFADANLPGPDYFEFSKMTEAMQMIPDEKARYAAAFAGLQVQGLDKQKLLATANEYLKVIDADAQQFNATVHAALEEKVSGKQEEIASKSKRIEALAQEITQLQQDIASLQQQVKENEEKIYANNSGYNAASENMKHTILRDIQKIQEHIL